MCADPAEDQRRLMVKDAGCVRAAFRCRVVRYLSMLLKQHGSPGSVHVVISREVRTDRAVGQVVLET